MPGIWTQTNKWIFGVSILLMTSGCGLAGGGGALAAFFGGSAADAIASFAIGASGLPDALGGGFGGGDDTPADSLADVLGDGSGGSDGTTTVASTVNHAVVHNPEPSSLALLGLGATAAAFSRRRARKRTGAVS